jgi:hypothetical protein
MYQEKDKVPKPSHNHLAKHGGPTLFILPNMEIPGDQTRIILLPIYAPNHLSSMHHLALTALWSASTAIAAGRQGAEIHNSAKLSGKDTAPINAERAIMPESLNHLNPLGHLIMVAVTSPLPTDQTVLANMAVPLLPGMIEDPLGVMPTLEPPPKDPEVVVSLTLPHNTAATTILTELKYSGLPHASLIVSVNASNVVDLANALIAAE